MFDKVQYWKNRKAGKRGQGDEPTTVRPVLGIERPMKSNKTVVKTKRARKAQKEDN